MAAYNSLGPLLINQLEKSARRFAMLGTMSMRDV